MKKFTAVIIATLLAVSVMACGEAETVTEKEAESSEALTTQEVTETSSVEETKSETAGKFTVGYGQVNISPTGSVPLAGYGNTEKRMSQGLYSYLFTTCTAFTDEVGTTMLIFANDLINSNWKNFEQFADYVSEALSIPKDHILFTCSHTHSGPDLSVTTIPYVVEYIEFLKKAFTEAGALALADRAEARMFYASTEVNDMSFQRHYVLRDGTKWGYSPESSNPAVGYAGYKDTQMQFLKFVRSEFNPEKKDILITNWQVHPHRAGSSSDYNITADIAGMYRDTVQKKLGCLCQYITGAAGNTNPKSPISGDNVTDDFKQQGKAMAEYAFSVEDQYEELETGLIDFHPITFTVNFDHTMDDKIAVAQDVQAYWKTTNDMTATKAYGKPYGINSPYHAGKIVSAANWPATNDFSLWYGSIGDFAFVTFPGEMFAKGSLIVKEGSPYKATFFIGYCNGAEGYFPTEDAYEYVGYETDVTHYERGTAERVTTALAQSLKDLYNKK